MHLKRNNKLQIEFYNPNSDEGTAEFLSELFAKAAVEKYLENLPTNWNELLNKK